MKSLASLAVFLLLAMRCVGAEPAREAIYANDFERAKINELPDGFMIMSGSFTVKEEKGNKFLELPGAPLDTFGVLYGPAVGTGIGASARFFGSKQGRKFPTFGVSINGVAGYRLQVSPAKKTLEIYKGDEPKTSVPFEWQSDTWTSLRVRIRAADDGFLVEGKAWRGGEPEPAKWMVTLREKEEPPPGRAGIWGSPYSGTAIRFDDLVITKEH